MDIGAMIEHSVSCKGCDEVAAYYCRGEAVCSFPCVIIDLPQRRAVVKKRELVGLIDNSADRLGMYAAACAMQDDFRNSLLALFAFPTRFVVERLRQARPLGVLSFDLLTMRGKRRDEQ
jgi:hypothetical protein